ncbi:MAG: YsnF/AvaK domain-containing protein [Acidobacteriaceae bacterium]|nr:YsnF/AvaK domain-containing protein [Acidobacteriaceae bacterium]MBV9779317.1 YsnF/AvaK domain-containing protein [Acidobacteriaceae bacterium]
MPGENTIIAAFPNVSDAQAAATDLQAAGISRSDIYIETGADKSTRSTTESTEGGITGWLKSIFGADDSDRSEYENLVRQGNCLLRVDVDQEDIGTVEEILNRHSPIDVRAETGRATSAKGAKGATDAIPVVREEVQVGKRQVLRGGVRLYSRVVEEPVEEKVTLREERVRVQRQPVDRPATQADLSAGREQVVEVQEFAEEPVVAKQARVVEEVRVGKEVSERTETVRDTVRHTEVEVEQTPATSQGRFDDSDFRSDFQKRYASGGVAYDTYLPAYRYGYEMASDPRYEGRSFDEIETDLRSDYNRRYPQSTWERMKDAIRYGWDKVTGKARATAG